MKWKFRSCWSESVSSLKVSWTVGERLSDRVGLCSQRDRGAGPLQKPLWGLIRARHWGEDLRHVCEDGLRGGHDHVDRTRQGRNASEPLEKFGFCWRIWKHSPLVPQCLHVWDLDVRGYHNGLWRLFRKRNHILVVAVPISPYSWVILGRQRRPMFRLDLGVDSLFQSKSSSLTP